MAYKKSDKLNIRERKFIKGLAAGLTPTDAMRQAGYAENTALRKAGVKVQDSRVQASIQEMMEKKGLTKDKLLDKLDEGLDATKAIVTGEDIQAVKDYSIRHRYLDTALKLGAHYPADKLELSGKVTLEQLVADSFSNPKNSGD